MKTTITVTAEDIAGGCQDDCENCPIARAVARIYGAGHKVYSDEIKHPDGTVTHLPGEAIDAIQAYDVGLGMEPFSFDVEMP